MKKVLVIAGPTASGKSDFAVRLAKEFGWQIISGDSVQVYRGMDIGSGKVTEEEMDGVVHHLIDIRDPQQEYSAADFQHMARELIDGSDTPMIICGGTGLYLKSCLYDYSFAKEDGPSVDPEFEAMSDEELYALLQKTDPAQTQKIHPHNRRRIMRSLTIARRSGKPQSELEKEQSHEMIYDTFIAGLTMDRAVLYDRINRRVEKMFGAGLQEEVSGLLEKGIRFSDPGMQGIGYKEWKMYYEGEASADEVKEAIQKHSRQFAKRQYTWLNHQMPVHWFDITDTIDTERIINEIRFWRNRT